MIVFCIQATTNMKNNKKSNNNKAQQATPSKGTTTTTTTTTTAKQPIIARVSVPVESVPPQQITASSYLVKNANPVTIPVTAPRLITNHFLVSFKNTLLYLYNVQIKPSIDNPKAAARLVEHLGKPEGALEKHVFVYDGLSLLFSTTPVHKEPEKTLQLIATSKSDNAPVTHQVTLSFARTVPSSEFSANLSHLYNKIIVKMVQRLGYAYFGNHCYDLKKAIDVPNFPYQIFPGYIVTTKINSNMTLEIGIAYRLLRKDNVLDQMNKMKFDKKRCASLIVGTSVVPAYGTKQTAKLIASIAWNMNPMNTFVKDNKKITFVQYYKQTYNLDIKDKQQPLLVFKQGKTKEMYLIPELCKLTGLTDDIRGNFSAMKAIKSVSGPNPKSRYDAAMEFRNSLMNNPKAIEVGKLWNVEICDAPLDVPCTILKPSKLVSSNNAAVAINAKDYSWRDTGKFFKPVPIETWLCVCLPYDVENTKILIHELQNCAKKTGVVLGAPKMIVPKNEQEYGQVIMQNAPTKFKMVVFVVPEKTSVLYDVVKIQMVTGIQMNSQCVVSRTMERNGFNTIAHNILCQMVVKLGGIPYVSSSLKLPPNSMVIGIDVFHSGEKGAKTLKSWVALISTYDKYACSTYNTAKSQDPGKEISDVIHPLVVDALENFKKHNNAYPSTVFIYRDGVGQGQIEELQMKEIDPMKAIIKQCNPECNFVYMLVQKRINAKFCTPSYENPSPGTIVDYGVTEKNAQDFYLVAQNVTQGCATPTRYQVLHNERQNSTFGMTYLESLTFELCHLYFNWRGTVRVPSPCMLAHKLAFFLGKTIMQDDSKWLQLKNFPFFM